MVSVSSLSNGGYLPEQSPSTSNNSKAPNNSECIWLEDDGNGKFELTDLKADKGISLANLSSILKQYVGKPISEVLSSIQSAINQEVENLPGAPETQEQKPTSPRSMEEAYEAVKRQILENYIPGESPTVYEKMAIFTDETGQRFKQSVQCTVVDNKDGSPPTVEFESLEPHGNIWVNMRKVDPYL